MWEECSKTVVQSRRTGKQCVLHVGLGTREHQLGRQQYLKRMHTIPILSAYFLLMGLVSQLTNVPSGNSINVRGLSFCSACLPSDANRDARYNPSEAQDRARKMKSKNCIPCTVMSVERAIQNQPTYPS
jgi:hypothetical protein